ncbi:CooT family nickel-binding protein [Methanomethylovorans sp.]|uniref:CooT family nickel-binding protein n=1 Tax=Methanomethylovorans sp. TaxID=2758717 RepID=UPI00351C88F4
MCDFTVYLEDDRDRKMVAKDILKARKKDGTVILMDAMGNITKVEAANIEVVDTLMQEMILKKT